MQAPESHSQMSLSGRSVGGEVVEVRGSWCACPFSSVLLTWGGGVAQKAACGGVRGPGAPTGGRGLTSRYTRLRGALCQGLGWGQTRPPPQSRAMGLFPGAPRYWEEEVVADAVTLSGVEYEA